MFNCFSNQSINQSKNQKRNSLLATTGKYFEKHSYAEHPTFGLPYNIRSVMHFDKRQFAKNHRLSTFLVTVSFQPLLRSVRPLSTFRRLFLKKMASFNSPCQRSSAGDPNDGPTATDKNNLRHFNSCGVNKKTTASEAGGNGGKTILTALRPPRPNITR